MRDPAASSRPTVAGVGCPYELGPTQITATLGRVSARNAEVVEYREPWCATLSTSMGGPRAQMLPTAASLGPVQSPVKRKLLPPASRRSTTLSLLASPERPAGLSTSPRAAADLDDGGPGAAQGAGQSRGRRPRHVGRARAPLAHDVREPARVVGMHVRDDDGAEAAYAELGQRRLDDRLRARRAAVDEARPGAGLDDRGVALPHATVIKSG